MPFAFHIADIMKSIHRSNSGFLFSWNLKVCGCGLITIVFTNHTCGLFGMPMILRDF